MEKQTKLQLGSGKQKRKAQVTVSEPKNIKLTPSSPKRQRTESQQKPSKKLKKPKTKESVSEKVVNLIPVTKPEEITVLQSTAKTTIEKKKPQITAIVDTSEKYPILKDKELIDKFMKVPLTNNQKGRIRQAYKAQLQSSDATLSPDIVNGKIQTLLKSTENLTDSDLKRIRILHNMLKTALEKSNKIINEETPKKVKKNKNKKNKKKIDEDVKEPLVQKVKGPKRYVVFIGNLPLDVTKDKIMNHFAELNEQIKDIRIQKPTEGKKKAFAYVELSNEPSFELALSKHHSMLGSNRINVLYTTQQKSKISKAEAKSKTAKLIALQKTGKLVGSLPLTKKRSHRRMILKKARAKAEAEANS